MMHHTKIEIVKEVLINNIQLIKEWIGSFKSGVKYCLPVKANAYGHGLVGIAHLSEPYIDYFGVACLNEGVELRANGITKPIIVFGSFADEQIAELLQYNLEITIASMYKAKLVAEFCESMKIIAKVHIKVDTGMNRVGVRVEKAQDLIDYVRKRSCFDLIGVYSHLSNSEYVDDEYTKQQIQKFSKIVDYVKSYMPQVICHIANSGGVINYSESLFDMVRPGIMSYGYSPAGAFFPEGLSGILPCLSLISEVSYFKVVQQGQGISYNHKYITKEMTRVVTVPIGYGDGYRRVLSNIGEVLIREQRYKIAGTICMDMFMVDIGMNGVAYIGDEVVLIGRQGEEEILLHDLANKCGTISYEILCGFNNRIRRVYI